MDRTRRSTCHFDEKGGEARGDLREDIVLETEQTG
jgi:hypothetical protein